MAAFVSTARPVSQILPTDYDLFPSSSSASTSSLKPRPQGHYRPFSTLGIDSPYIEVQQKPARLLKRASSFGGLQSFQKMNLGLTFKPRKNAHSSTSILAPMSQLGTPTPKVSHPTLSHKPRLAKTIPDVTKSSSSSLRLASPVPSLRKKRSMISLFTGSDVITSSPTEPSVPSPQLGSRPVTIPPPIPEDSPTKFSSKSARSIDMTNEDNSTLSPFICKDMWATRSNMRLHPYQSEVPYMQAYDRILLESDRYSDLLLRRLTKGSPSFTEFIGKGPATALDLGCGEGNWVIYAASIWKDSQITGFDLVDVTCSAFKSTENARFVQGDFIKYKLPFPDQTFDYVRMANLLLCVPYNCWDKLLSEVRRVLRDNGRIEIIDDELHFPYSPPPKMKERPRSFGKSRNISEYGIYDDLDSDLDGDTLQGYESGEDSTFTSEETCVSSLDDEPSYPSSLSPSETVRPIYRPRHSSTCDPDKKSSITDAYLAQPDSVIWKQRVMASRELETTFEAMLMEYGLFPQPAEFMLELMKRTFGSDAGKTKSFHIRLAEWNSPIGPTPSDMVDDPESKDGSFSDGLGNKKRWATTLDWDKKKSKKRDGIPIIVEVPSERPSFDSPIPDSLKPKAAKQLGLTIATQPVSIKGKKDKTPSPPPLSPVTPPALSTLPLPIPVPMSLSPVKMGFPKAPNAKTAALLGVSYSQLVVATAKATGTPVVGYKPLGLVQSPGLLIGEKEYVAVDSSELEMHACKNIHTLLGCRPALGQYIARFKDENGVPLVDDDMFTHLMWEYETFRRTRLGWPSGNAFDQNEEEPESKDDSQQKARPVQHFDSFSYNPSANRCQPDEPIHIRTIRIFEGRKLSNEPVLFGFLPGSPKHH